MRSINLGIMLTQESTTLAIQLPSEDVSAIARLVRDGRTPAIAIPRTGATFQIALTAGAYVLTVDSELRPSKAAPFRVTTTADASFWSAVHPDPGTDPRPPQGGTGRVIVVSNPKDPWPDLPPFAPRTTASDGLLASSAPIASAMRSLLDASAGRGAGSERPPPRSHALLIGIDHYDDGPGGEGVIYRSLRGCVNDVLEVEKLLRSSVPDIAITRLIGRAADGAEAERPTYANIVAAWHHLIATAAPGDLVYIHYSGHGGRAKTRFAAHKPSQLDESLVPCDINDRERGQYLRDVEIALLLQRMAERGLVTTVVLDSCHSGGTTRGDQAQARSGSGPDEDERPLASAVATPAELDAVARTLVHHPSFATWRLDAGRLRSSVTVLAACRETEAAYEYAPTGEQRHGAFSYFWLQALAQRTATTTYQRIYDQVFANVHNVFAHQTPLLFGDPHRVVLGSGVLVSRPAVPVLAIGDDEEIKLGAGAYALIGRGSHLAIVPPDQVPELVDLAEMVEVVVTDVTGMHAYAERVPGTGKGAAIVVGAQGLVRSYPPRLRRSVRLLASPVLTTAAHAALAAAIAGDPSHLLSLATGDGGDYQVLVDGAPDAYVVCDAAGTALANAPATPIADPRASASLVEQLVHLARYSNVLALADNDPNASLAGKLTLELLSWPGYDPEAIQQPAPIALPAGPVPVEVPVGEYFCLRARNGSQHNLQFAVLDLDSSWQISLVDVDGDTLYSGKSRDIALRATLPRGVDRARDVLKVVAALAGPDVLKASLLTLPALGRPREEPAARGQSETLLDQLLRTMQDPTVAHRQVEPARSPSRGWTVAQAELAVVRPRPRPAAVRSSDGELAPHA